MSDDGRECSRFDIIIGVRTFLHVFMYFLHAATYRTPNTAFVLLPRTNCPYHFTDPKG